MDRIAAATGLEAWLETIDSDAPLSTYQGTYDVPFQRWFKFKEAYSPLLVKSIIESSDRTVKSCLDPCGGCGTTAVTSQFMGIKPTVIEVNPFLADVVAAKLSDYSVKSLERDIERWHTTARKLDTSIADERVKYPPSFCENSENDRWIYPTYLFKEILRYVYALEKIENTSNRRLLKVILGSVLVSMSNVIVNGKGRKYRQGWEKQQKTSADLRLSIENATGIVLEDIKKYPHRADAGYNLARGTCIKKVDDVDNCDIAIFSPPYPNSFDYTDVYNIELWALGYITTKAEETNLRKTVIRSHVQRKLDHSRSRDFSPKLAQVRKKLDIRKDDLWDNQIPDMVESYFHDIHTLLYKLKNKIRPGGTIAMVVGDSAYAGIRIPVAEILEEMAPAIGLNKKSVRVMRNMKRSAQQGWKGNLNETLVQFKVPPKLSKKRPR